MKKIPTVFQREEGHQVGYQGRYVIQKLTEGCEWVMDYDSAAVATRKYDGTCMMFDGINWWARREVKPGKPTPPYFTRVERDVFTGKEYGGIPADDSDYRRYFYEALTALTAHWPSPAAGTYELIGPKVNGNPEKTTGHHLIRHADAETVTDVDRSWGGIFWQVRMLFETRGWEGLVFHHPDGRMAKIKFKDYRPETT